MVDETEGAAVEAQVEPAVVEEIGVRTVKKTAKVKSEAAVAMEQMEQAAPEAPPPAPVAPKRTAKPIGIDAIVGMTGAAFASIADLIGDALPTYFREVPLADITSPDDVTDQLVAIADEVRLACPVGRSPQVVTFDFSPVGDALFIGVRVRFV